MTRYGNALKTDARIQKIQKKIEGGSSSFKDLDSLAAAAGIIAGECMAEQLREEYPDGQVPENEVRRIISPIMKENFKFVTEMAAAVQTAQYKKAGIGLKAVIPEYDTGREDELVKEISERSYEDGFFGRPDKEDDGNRFQKIRG